MAMEMNLICEMGPKVWKVFFENSSKNHFPKILKNYFYNFILFSVINQIYNAEITPSEYVMRGNSAIIKCLIPSFVADFVQVFAWIDEDGKEFNVESDFSGGKMRENIWILKSS